MTKHNKDETIGYFRAAFWMFPMFIVNSVIALTFTDGIIQWVAIINASIFCITTWISLKKPNTAYWNKLAIKFVNKYYEKYDND